MIKGMMSINKHGSSHVKNQVKYTKTIRLCYYYSTEKCLSKCQRVKGCQRLPVGSPFDGLLEKGFPYHLAAAPGSLRSMSLSIFFSVHSLIHFQSGMDGSVNSSASWQETRDFSLLPLIDIFFPFPMADLRPMVWKLPKMSRLNFCPIKSNLSGNPVWPPASGFQPLAPMDHLGPF